MRKKIALMTWHHVSNYGTALQAYALKTALEKLGCNVDLIDYMRTGEAPLCKRSFGREVKKLFQKRQKLGRFYTYAEESFQDFFNENFSYTLPCKYNDEFAILNSVYDGFVCGSDQIWGPEWLDGRYFLDFVVESERKIAYAPSIGVSNIVDKDISQLICKYAREFDYISVRESTGCKVISDLMKREVFNAIDPVGLLEPAQWSELAEKRQYEEKYMLVFLLKNNDEYMNEALKIAKEKNLQVKVFHCTQSEDNLYANIHEASVYDFLSWIKYAEFVCTDSFHVMMFSFIFNKQLLVFEKDRGSVTSKGSRIKDVLRRLNIDEVLFSKQKTYSSIDYSTVNKELEEWRRESLEFLEKAVKNLPEKVCNHQKVCNACKNIFSENKDYFYTPEFLQIKKNATNRYKKILIQNMDGWNFACKQECYGCRYFQELCIGWNKKQPVFYKELVDQMGVNDGKITKIYYKFYLFYTIPMLSRKVRDMVKRYLSE